MGEKLTRGDVKRIEEEISHRKLVVRKELIEAVKEARAHGDLSENFEYYAAKREKNINESRIRYLERMLRNATVIDTKSSPDEVGLNRKVEIWYVDDDETETFKIVTSVRGDSLKNRISIISPLGKALMKHHVGDRVTVRVNDSVCYDVVIRSIGPEEEELPEEMSSY
ncbi:MAG: transcription elongation factor GreA [Lachnospiraceae bacterium]|nr:transcription elongation factor GreA [Lachnospiraceae bacterium]